MNTSKSDEARRQELYRAMTERYEEDKVKYGIVEANVRANKRTQAYVTHQDDDVFHIYLAARYSRILEMQSLAGHLDDYWYGHIRVVSSWIEEIRPNSGSIDYWGQRAKDIATRDLEDLSKANLVVAFTEEPRTVLTRGGRHVEAGYALANNIQLGVVGPLENVFYSLADWHIDDHTDFELILEYIVETAAEAL